VCYIGFTSPEHAFYFLITWSDQMPSDDLDPAPGLAQRVETRVRQSAHGQIRNLLVEEVQGQVIVSGQAPSRHAKQLALQGALELISGDRFAEKITVG
jgi:hypothetical protein